MRFPSPGTATRAAIRSTAVLVTLAAAALAPAPTPASAAPGAPAPEPAPAAAPIAVPALNADGSATIPIPSADPAQATALTIPAELLPHGAHAPGAAAYGLGWIGAAALAANYLGDERARDLALEALPHAQRDDVHAVITALDSPVAPPSAAPEYIVALGNGLADDGSVHPNLARRLEVAEELAARYPSAGVVVTGGAVSNEHVEAHAMRDWLVARGMDPARIIVEGDSWSTVSNAVQTWRLIPGARSLAIATTDHHLHRGVVDFTSAFGAGVTVTGVPAVPDPPRPRDPRREKLETYRDAIGFQVLPRTMLADGLPPFFGTADETW